MMLFVLYVAIMLDANYIVILAIANKLITNIVVEATCL